MGANYMLGGGRFSVALFGDSGCETLGGALGRH